MEALEGELETGTSAPPVFRKQEKSYPAGHWVINYMLLPSPGLQRTKARFYSCHKPFSSVGLLFSFLTAHKTIFTKLRALLLCHFCDAFSRPWGLVLAGE